MSTRVRVGVIGAGAIAMLRHLPAFKRAEADGIAELVAVADPVEENLQRAAETFQIPHATTDYQELLALPLDAVSICTPNAWHEEIALAALDRGLHVMCEKPLALTYAGARRMADRAAAAGVRTAVNFRYRWVPASIFARDIIRSGDLGEIYHVFGSYFNGSLADPTTPVQWRQSRAASGSGVLGDLGSHLIDLCRFWIGEIASVQGYVRTLVTERPLVGGGTATVDVDDLASFNLWFEQGGEASCNTTRYAIGRVNYQRVEVYGSKGALIYGLELGERGGDELQLCLGASQARYSAFATVPVPVRYRVNTPESPMLDFVENIAEGRPISPDFTDGLRCQEILEAIEQSSADSRRVTLPLALDER